MKSQWVAAVSMLASQSQYSNRISLSVTVYLSVSITVSLLYLYHCIAASLMHHWQSITGKRKHLARSILQLSGDFSDSSAQVSVFGADWGWDRPSSNSFLASATKLHAIGRSTCTSAIFHQSEPQDWALWASEDWFVGAELVNDLYLKK